MTFQRDLLQYLHKRPFWAMLREFVDPLFASLAVPVPDGDRPLSFAVEKRKVIAQAISDGLRNTEQAGRKAAIIPILGPLCSSEGDAYWEGGTTYAFIQDAITRAMADQQVAEIFLLVDSPGGEVLNCPETAEMIYQANKIKPVTALVTGIAASAAYYLASQATQIILTPSGEVGSVGVIWMHFDVTGLMTNLGVKVTEMVASDHKMDFSPFRPLSDEAKADGLAIVNTMYEDFLAAVERGRPHADKADKYGNGRMLMANDALAAGMVDAVAPIRDVFAARIATNKAMEAAKARAAGLERMTLTD